MSSPPSPPQNIFSYFSRAKVTGERIGIYGTGGIGKTSLALMAPGQIVVVDLDESVARLSKNAPVFIPSNWQSLMDGLKHPEWWKNVNTIIIDSMSVAEDMCLAHTLAHVRTDKGALARRIEDYGFGKGYRYLYDEFLPLFQVLDTHRTAGRNIILISHTVTANVPNPQGEDYIRYEPRLQGNEKHSIRLRMKEWLDHLFFIGYDVNVRDNKGKGCGTRTIYTQEYPHCLAKCRAGDRSIPPSLEYEEGSAALWRLIFPTEYKLTQESK